MTSTTDRTARPWPTRRERECGPQARRAGTAERTVSADRPAAYAPRHAAAEPDVTERRPAVAPAAPVPEVRTDIRQHAGLQTGPLRDGLAIAAVCLGAIGLPFGLLPVTGFLAAGLGVLALAFGIAGWSRARSGTASNRGTAVTAAVLGLIALGLGVAGTVAFVRAPDRLVYDLSELTAPSPGAIAVTPSGE